VRWCRHDAPDAHEIIYKHITILMNKLVAARWFLKELEPMLLAYLYRCLRDMLLAYLGFRYLVTSQGVRLNLPSHPPNPGVAIYHTNISKILLLFI
jgi:hypothetical protein